MTNLLLCLRVLQVDGVHTDNHGLFLQLKTSHSFIIGIKSSVCTPPPRSVNVKFNEDFILRLPFPLPPSFHTKVCVKESHTFLDKTLAKGTLDVSYKPEQEGIIQEGVLKMKSSSQHNSSLHYQYYVLTDPGTKEVTAERNLPNPRVWLPTGTTYYPGDTLRGVVVYDRPSFDSKSRVGIVTSSEGTTFDVVATTNLFGSTCRYTDFRHYEANRVVSDSFPLFTDPPNSTNVKTKLYGQLYTVPFEFQIPRGVPISLADVPRLPYFSEKVGRKLSEELHSLSCKWDKLPIAHTALSVEVYNDENKITVTQPLTIRLPMSEWESRLGECASYTDRCVSSIRSDIEPSSTSDTNEFITAEVFVPEKVHIKEKFRIGVKINSRLCKKLCKIEVRIGTAAEFHAKMVSITKYYTGDHKVENGPSLKTTDMSTVFRATIPDFEVHEGETKEGGIEVTLDNTCFPTLMPSMYPLITSWSWVEVSIQKGTDDDGTYSLGNKYHVLTMPLVVLPELCSHPPPSPTALGDDTVDNNSPNTLLGIKTMPPTLVDNIPFLLPTADGAAFVQAKSN